MNFRQFLESQQTESSQFKQWFQGSKVVDDQGNPLRCYHGTTHQFTQFNKSGSRTNYDKGYSGKGYYFSNSPDTASVYAGQKRFGDYESNAQLMPVFLQIKNPLIIQEKPGGDDQIVAVAKALNIKLPPDINGINANRIMPTISEDITKALIQNGYDGVIYKWGRSQSKNIEYMVIDPTQIKSAIGNKGTWSPTNPEIQENIKNLLEIVELKKPKDAKKQNIIKDKGTNVARKVIQYKWTTKNNNVVKMTFEPNYPNLDEYFIMFYVNDVLFDFASKKEGLVRDIDILGNVFYLLKHKANALKAQTLKFRAHKGEKDKERVFNLNIEQPKKRLLDLIKLEKEKHKGNEWLPVSPEHVDLYKKINKSIPDKIENWILKSLQKIENEITDNKEVDYPNFNNPDLMLALKKYNQAVQSHSSIGVELDRNRRQKIYEKILKKDFSNDWNISINNGLFVLTRK